MITLDISRSDPLLASPAWWQKFSHSIWNHPDISNGFLDLRQRLLEEAGAEMHVQPHTGLVTVTFEKDSDSTFFILRWS
jgi:hypothetical protein